MIASDKTFLVLKHNVADVKQTLHYCSDSCNVCTISRPHPYISVMLFGNGNTVINLSNSLAGIQDVGWTIKTYVLLALLALCHLWSLLCQSKPLMGMHEATNFMHLTIFETVWHFVLKLRYQHVITVVHRAYELMYYQKIACSSYLIKPSTD